MLELIERFKLVWFIAIFLAGIVGFQAITPAMKIAALEARVARVEVAQDSILYELRIQRRLSCLDRDIRDRALAGLDCGNIPYTGIIK